MADVAATLASWSSTDSSNSPAGTTVIGGGLDDNLRAIQGVVVRGLSHKGNDIASATTTDLGAVEGLGHDITGTTTITGLGTVRAGILKVIKFEGALTLTHNATSLILPGGASITTADGDVAVMFSEGSGNWRCWGFLRAAAVPLTYATQAQQETGTSTVVAVSPGVQHFHPGHPKGWGLVAHPTTVTISYPAAGVSVVNSSTGVYVVTHGLTFSSVNYIVNATVVHSATVGRFARIKSRTATTVTIEMTSGDGTLSDVDGFNYVVLGDL